EADPGTRRRLRLLFVWMTTAFVLVAVSGRQRERYYLPLCPAMALLIGWWYARSAWRWRAWTVGGGGVAVGGGGLPLLPADTLRYNTTTDLRELRAVLAQAPAPLFSVDLQDLALSFNLDRPVVNDKGYPRFEARARQGTMGYLLISDRALASNPADPCM